MARDPEPGPRPRPEAPTVLGVVGFVALIAGVWQISEPAALIVAGALLIALAIASALAAGAKGPA
jgi:hypothetical protein